MGALPQLAFRLLQRLTLRANQYVSYEHLLLVVWRDHRAAAAIRSAPR